MRELSIQVTNESINKKYPDNLGKRSKFGGNPTWIQNDETPNCIHCKNKMDFIAQIDSIDYTGSAESTYEYMFGDVGIIYIFFCKKCGDAKAIFQE